MLVLTRMTRVLKLFCSELMLQTALNGKINSIKQTSDKSPIKQQLTKLASSEFESRLHLPFIFLSFFLFKLTEESNSKSMNDGE